MNGFTALAGGLRGRAHALVEQTLEAVDAHAQAIVPVRTGALKASIEHHMEGETSGVVSAGASYAAYVEYGTVRAPAQPYMHPAFDAAQPAFEAGLAKLLEP